MSADRNPIALYTGPACIRKFSGELRHTAPQMEGNALADIILDDASAPRGSVHHSIFPSRNSCVRLWRSDRRNSLLGSPANAGGGLGDVFDIRKSHSAGNFGIVW